MEFTTHARARYWTADGELAECIVVTIAGQVVGVLDAEGEPIDVNPDDVLIEKPET